MEVTFPDKNHTQKYLLGVDIGSSKTHALISDMAGKLLSFGEAGCGNYEVVGVDGFIEALNRVANTAISSAGIEKHEIASMGFGISGYDWPSEDPIMVKAIQSLQIDCPNKFVNDVMLGLIAGSTEGWGIVADAGTGNNVRGRDKSGKMGRITGNGIRFGEFGGASELVWRGMLAATYAWSQRGSKTRITQLLMDFAQVNSEGELIEGLATDKIQLNPALAKEIIRLAREEDLQAQEAVRFTAHELALNVNAVIRQLEFEKCEFEVVMMGSVFNAGEIYIKPFKKKIKQFAPQAKFVHLSIPPVVGSVLLAAETIGLRNRSIRKTLTQSIKEISL